MFGKNPIRKQELDPAGKLWVQEIFPTIQGEGPRAGQPAVFIRLAGCNLACKFCDTEFESGTWRDWQDVAQEASRLTPEGWRRKLFVLTGGEPFRQNIVPLIKDLLFRGAVQIETAGTLWLNGIDIHKEELAQLVVSPKTGSLHPSIYAHAKHFKYIIRDGEVDEMDGLPNANPQTGIRQRLARPNGADQVVWVQPCDEHDPIKTTKNLTLAKEIALRFGYNLSMQQHKLLNLP